MVKLEKTFFAPALLIVVLLAVVALNQPGLSQGNQSLQEKVAKLEESLEKLRGQIPRIGYVNRQEAFSVFPQEVEEERREIIKLEKEMEDLTTQAREGKISESDHNRQRDLLRAQHLRARTEVDLAILETMIQARGFSENAERLEGLKSQVLPMRDAIDNLISEIKDYAVSPQQVSETLSKVENEQFRRLDDILIDLAQNKITQLTQQLAEEKDYDLVIERQNVITYRKEAGQIDDLTEEVKERIKQALRS
ncbi:MAG: hypothetical protein ACOCZX_04505 [Candidatus Bipolaricaulota bacterium]